ncbi:MAG: hypothetical protein M9963_12185 [Kiritimatiellae bacterium]|nr:hypothetical protein [Kiritimatiellia bacterium]MCO5062730.1 hypothetical protein [Kiritimatiellia bacterium]MCO5067075.1 hypothetical protein [Kiritimatiellia bacterium]MCO6400458.1 hypothetical protein [Verrucomicrobiota bacterium]
MNAEAKKRTGGAFSPEEVEAMRERARELKAEARESKNCAAGEKALLAAIVAMTEPDRSLASGLHALISREAPALLPKTWYGMPAYTNAEGNVICFFQAAGKFKTRYATFGFQHDAHLDEGDMWPTSFALIRLTAKEEATITALLKKAIR